MFNPTNIIAPNNQWGEIDLSFLERENEVKSIDYVDIFGQQIADYIDQASKASSCSREYIMLYLLVISSSIIGNKRKTKVREGWEEPIHIWGALVGNPSCRKSAAMTPFYKALTPLMHRRKEDYNHRKEVYLNRVKSIKEDKEKKSICSELIAGLNKPTLKQIILNDTTTEALCNAIEPDKPECICLFRDELVGFLKNLEKYNKNDKTLFLEGYNSNSYTINRVGKEEPIQIAKLSISLLGGIQPEKFAPILKSDDDGFISRFLFAHSDPTKIKVIGDDFYFDNSLLQQIFNKLDADLKDTEVLILSNESKQLFQKWLDKHFKDQDCASGLLGSSYGKMHGQIIRIACILEHLF